MTILMRMVLFCLAASSLSAGTVAHYTFDTDYQDSSSNASHGTLVDAGTPGNSGITTAAGAWQFGGGALDLSADRDYVAVPSRTFGSGSPYSIAFWARKAPGDTGEAATYDMVIGERGAYTFLIGLNNASNGLTGLRWQSNTNTTGVRWMNFASPDDTNWHHHVITADSAKRLTYYLDGGLVAMATNVMTGFTYDTIGDASATNRDYDFNGQLDEVWVFDEALTPAAVSNLYGVNAILSTPVATSAVLRLRFDADCLDSSPSTNHATAMGGATFTTNVAQVPVGSGALLLDGQDGSYVSLTRPIQFTAQDPWSITFWAQRGETGSSKGMVIGERFTSDDFIWLNDSYSGLRFRSSTNQTLDFTAPKTTALHHYALVAGGDSSLTLYVDGTRSQTLSGDTSFTIDTVGQAYPTNSSHLGFQGLLDEVGVYHGALTAAAVLSLYQERAALPTSTVTRVRVFLVGGQSNADGRAAPAGLPTSPANLQQPQPDIDYYYRIIGGAGSLTTLRPGTSFTSQFGPEVTFGHDLAGLLTVPPSNRVALVKYADGGTSQATDWKAGGNATTNGDGPDYVTFQQTVTAGLAALQAAYPGASVGIEGLVWMQGESDAVSGSTTYKADLQDFITDIRATYGATLPFVIGRLSSKQIHIAAAGLAAVMQAQTEVAAADPWTGLVDTDTFALNADNLHFSAAGQQLLGSGFAFQTAYLLWMSGAFRPAMIAAGRTDPAADADGDGIANDAEFVAGTDPTNALSVLQASLRGTGPGVFEISYPSVTGRHYSVETQGALTNTVWTPTLTPLAGTGNPVARAVTNSAAAGYLRILVDWP